MGRCLGHVDLDPMRLVASNNVPTAPARQEQVQVQQSAVACPGVAKRDLLTPPITPLSRPACPQGAAFAAPPSRRRVLAALPGAALVWASSRQPAQASENAGGVDSATSPLVQGKPLARAGGQPTDPSCRERRLSVHPCASLLAPRPASAELLRRTEEKKAERAKERLEDYYRRNFGEYLSFQVGPVCVCVCAVAFVCVGRAAGRFAWQAGVPHGSAPFCHSSHPTPPGVWVTERLAAEGQDLLSSWG